ARDTAAAFGFVFAFTAATATTAEKAAAFRGFLRLADDRRLARGDVVAMNVAVVSILERLPAVLPRDRDRRQLDRAGDLLAHPLVLLVPGHCLEAILCDARER